MRSLVIAALAAGCGFGPFGDTPGGADNLPTLAAGPYEKLPIDFDTPADEPFVAADARAQLSAPSVLRRSDGGFRIWFARDEDDTENAGEIWYAEIPAVTELQDVVQDVLIVADQDWEQGDVRDPSVVDLGGDRLVMYYGGGVDELAIGRAESTDGGVTWDKDPSNPILSDAASPSVDRIGDDFFLAFARPSTGNIDTAVSDDGGLSFSGERVAVAPRRQTPDVFDKLSVSEPHLIAERTDTGRRGFSLFFTGQAPGDEPGLIAEAIGFAGSYDFAEWRRFGEGEPILQPGNPNESGPCALVETTGGTLFYSEQKQGRGRIAVATHP